MPRPGTQALPGGGGPFGAFLVGACLTFVGEMLRRGAIVHGYGNTIVHTARPSRGWPALFARCAHVESTLP